MQLALHSEGSSKRLSQPELMTDDESRIRWFARMRWRKSNLHFFSISLAFSSESVAFDHWAVAWIQNAIAEEVALHSVPLWSVQGILGLAHPVQHVLRCICCALQCSFRPNRSSHHGEWCNRWGFIHFRWVNCRKILSRSPNHRFHLRRYSS